MNDAAAFQALEKCIENWEGDIGLSTTKVADDAVIAIARQARAELANTRKLLEAAGDLEVRYADGLKSPIRMWAKLADAIAACRASAGKNQNA